MMTQKQFRLSAVAAILSGVFGNNVLADEISELIEPDSTISIGVGNWSGDRRQTGMYDAMQDKGVYGLFEADIAKRDNDTGTWYKLEARNLGLENRDIKAEVLRQGDIGASFEYSRIQRKDPNTYWTNVTGIGTPNMATSGTQPIYKKKLGTRREQMNFGFYKNLYQNGKTGLDFNLSYKNEDKTGARNWSTGNNFAPEPIDSTTRQMEASLSWTTEKLQLRGGYNGSWYENNISPLLTSGIGTYTLPPGNEAHQLFLNGGYNFTKDTRATLKLEYARATQDERFVDQSATNPRLNLGGEVVTTLMQLGLTSRITKDFSVNANLRYHDKDDKTPNGTNFFNQGGHDHPHFDQSIRTLSGKLEAVYRFADVYTLVGSVEEKRQRRDLKQTMEPANLVQLGFPTKLDETTTRLELRRSLTDTLNGSVSWVHAKRDGSSFDPMALPTGTTQQLSPFNTADRKRDKARFSLDWTPLEALSLQFVFEDGKDEYSGHNPLGLEEGKARLYSLDATWTVSEKLSFNAWYSYDENKAKQTMRHGNSITQTRRWDIEDSADSLGLGFKWEATSKFRTGGNLEWTKSKGQYDVAAWVDATGLPAAITPAGGGILPSDITDKHLRVSLFGQYALNKTSDLRLDVIYDKWK
ncbi:MAG: MtrB/PioB family decaheme-associated outer membrane protein, partial [Azonexus sp.]|nr:MtrB/PioB family decaheme-associated outer membrane protein [Azonexus sp.]